MTKDKIIEVNDLSVFFDEAKVLDEVSFSVSKEKVTVILGASGSGKTTIFRHLIGLYTSEPGRVSIMDKDISVLDELELKELYMKMGVFYQSGGLLGSLTVGENVGLPLEQHTDLPNDVIKDIVNLKLGLVELQHTYNMYPSQLSGGMFKRAALARAIVMDPVILFCDEPGAGLDPVSLSSLDNLIVELKEQMKMSVVMVTHEVSSILRIADNILFLEDGKIIFDGTLKDVLNSQKEQLLNFFEKGKGK